MKLAPVNFGTLDDCRKRYFFLLFMALLGVWACSQDGRSAGTGISTGNALLSGKALDAKRHPAVNAVVLLLPDSLNPVGIDFETYPYKTFSDSRGRFHLEDESLSGNFNLIIRSADSALACLIRNLEIGQKTPVVLPDQILMPTGTLTLPVAADEEGGHIFLPGTDISLRFAGDKPFIEIPKIPEGFYAAVMLQRENGPVAAFDSISISSGESNNQDPYQDLSSFRKIRLSTVELSREFAVDIPRFSLSIRLDTNWIDFPALAPRGADIRFLHPEYGLLPHEVAHWNSVVQTGQVWVLIDTLKANSANQAIWLRWGDPGASSASLPQRVFPAGDGCRGIWHLDETDTNALGQRVFVEASGSAVTAVDSALNRNGVDGFLGRGQGFAGGEKIIIQGDVPDFSQGGFTLSFWIRLLAPGGVALAKDDGSPVPDSGGKAFFFSDAGGGPNPGKHPAFHDRNHLMVVSKDTLALDVWNQVIYSRTADGDAGTFNIYINGKQTILDTLQSEGDARSLLRDNPGDHLTLGASGGEFLRGFLDEVWIFNYGVGAEWARVRYLNDLPGLFPVQP